MKQCTACKEKRPLVFQRTLCHDCWKSYSRNYRHTDAFRAKRRKWDKSHYSDAKKARGSKRALLYAERNPERPIAMRAVRSAIKNGVLVRPSYCQRCSTPDNKRRDGRSMIHAHHHDYSKPLDVEWLCALCHSTEHRKTAQLLKELEEK
jgi:hypothetical protein